jgi:hypothetical protein
VAAARIVVAAAAKIDRRDFRAAHLGDTGNRGRGGEIMLPRHDTTRVGGLLPARAKEVWIDPRAPVSRQSARAEPRLHASLVVSLALLAGCAALSALLANGTVALPGAWSFGASIASLVVTVAVTALAAYRRSGSSWRLVAISPLAVAAVTWAVLFVLRPLELYFFPDHAALPLGLLGFRLVDLTRPVALAGAGCATWCAAYLISLGRVGPRGYRLKKRSSVSSTGGVVGLALGTCLFLLLFLRQGGFGALLRSPISLRLGQGSSFYGFLGLWLVQGTALFALARLLTGGRNETGALRRLVWIGAALSVFAAVALELRGLVVFAFISAAAMVICVCRLRRRQLILGIAVAGLVVLGLGFAQQVRAYTSTMTTKDAIGAATRTPLWADFVSDLATYDHFAAMRELVPGSVASLHGKTLLDVPKALVPRALWPGKPQAVDARVASYLYPGASADVPISMQGELYWNGGLIAVLVGGLVLGLAFGLLARFGLRARPGSPGFVVYIVALPFTHAFLTRGFAPTTESIVFAVVGVTLAIGCMSPQWLFDIRVPRFLRRPMPASQIRRQTPRLTHVGAPAGHSGSPSKAATT